MTARMTSGPSWRAYQRFKALFKVKADELTFTWDVEVEACQSVP